MENKRNSPKSVWKFPPCPAYDIERTESWLQSMAGQGLILKKDGFFAGFANFEMGEPQSIRYRLEATQKGSFLSDGAPEQEELSLGEAFGWEYIAKRGDFFVFACAEPSACELHSDPKVQALALNRIRRRMWGDFFVLLFWLVVHPLLFGKGVFLLASIELGTPLYLMTHILIIWSVIGSMRSFLFMRSLQKRLRKGTPPDHRKDWKPRAAAHRFSIAAYFALLLCCGIMLLYAWNADATGKYETPLQSYTGELPFATLQDFVPGGTVSLDNMSFSNKIEVKSDLLASKRISLSQSGTVRVDNQTVLDGGLDVDYYETFSPWMARRLAVEYERYDRRTYRDKISPLAAPEGLAVDFICAYSAIFPTVIIADGNKMIRFSFYQTSPGPAIPLEDWVKIVVESIR